MAIYHLSVQVIKRADGRSVIAAAAYRACTKLYDKRQEKTFDYSDKTGLVDSRIFLPKGAPEWMRDRERVWNHLDSMERQWNGRPAREVQVALPIELTDEQNWALAEEFAAYFTEQGMLADVAFHAGHGEEQPHLHILLSMRDIDIALGDFAKTKNRDWNKKEWVQALRVDWQDLANRHLALNGHDVRIDHRTLEAQGVDLIPQNKIGISAAAAKRANANGKTGWRSERLDEHERIAEANGNAIITEPTLAFDALTAQQSTFSDADIARLANRHSIGSEQFTAVYQAILQSPELVSLGKNAKGEMRYTSRELLKIETRLVKHVEKMAAQKRHPVASRHVKRAITAKTLTPEQAEVLTAIVQGEDAVGIVGFAGTGKTHVLGAAKAAFEAEGYNVKGFALAGRAADGLLQDAGINARTIASHLLAWKEGRQSLSKNDILIFDETGMVDSRLLDEVIKAAYKAHAKVVLVGDHTQLQPIGAGAAFRAILQRIGFSSLTTIRRQKQDWMRVASKEFALGNTLDGLSAYATRGFVHQHDSQEMAYRGCVDSWWQKRQAKPKQTSTMTTYMRRDVAELNSMARACMRVGGKLGKDKLFTVDNGDGAVKRAFAVGDEIYFLKNDKKLNVRGVNEDNVGVKNGTKAIITGISGNTISTRILGSDARTIAFNVKDYNQIDYAYAATVHKLQGATVNHVDYFPSWNSNRYLSHVAMTRHTDSCDVHWSKDGFYYGYTSLQESFAREAIKDFTLDYATTRNIEPLIDVDGILIDEARGKQLESWMMQVDFAAIEAANTPQLAPLLRAKAEFDALSQHHEATSEAYREAQTRFMQIALDTKKAHEQHNILQGLDKPLIEVLTEHPILDALQQATYNQALREFNANRRSDRHDFDAFLSSFDWKDIEANQKQHKVLRELSRQHYAYQTATAQDNHAQRAESMSAILQTCDTLAADKDLYQEVVRAAPSLAEPLIDRKNQHIQSIADAVKEPIKAEQKALDDFIQNFDQWFDSVDWQSLQPHRKLHAVNEIAEEARVYIKVRNTSDQDLIAITKNDFIKTLGKTLVTEPLVVQKLPATVRAPLLQHSETLAKSYEKTRSKSHAYDFDL